SSPQPSSGLRRRPKTTASSLHPRRDGIIPLRVECVTLDIEGLHLRVADLDALRVAAGIKLASYRQASLGRGGGDQFDDCFAAGQGLASPGLSDVAEQPVLDPRIKSGDKPCSTSRSPADNGIPEASGWFHQPASEVQP